MRRPEIFSVGPDEAETMGLSVCGGACAPSLGSRVVVFEQ